MSSAAFASQGIGLQLFRRTSQRAQSSIEDVAFLCGNCVLRKITFVVRVYREISGSGRSQEFFRQGVFIPVGKNQPGGLDRIDLERMNRLRNREDEHREMDPGRIGYKVLVTVKGSKNVLFQGTMCACRNHGGFPGSAEGTSVLDEKSESKDEYD